jgi:hypothetical protein
VSIPSFEPDSSSWVWMAAVWRIGSGSHSSSAGSRNSPGRLDWRSSDSWDSWHMPSVDNIEGIGCNTFCFCWFYRRSF